jgi:hypothetical protein
VPLRKKGEREGEKKKGQKKGEVRRVAGIKE